MKDYLTDVECPVCHEHHVSVRYEDGASLWTYGACTTAQRELTDAEKGIVRNTATWEFWTPSRPVKHTLGSYVLAAMEKAQAQRDELRRFG